MQRLQKGKAMNGIGWAVKQMQDGQKVTRKGWNGKGQWLALQVPDANSANTIPYVYIHPTQGGRVPWVCSQTDLLAIDWEVAS